MRRSVGSEQNAVLISIEEITRSPRLSAQFADTRGNINRHIREPVEALGNVIEVLREIANVQNDKLCPRMAGEYTVARFEQCSIARKVVVVKRPMWVIVQFFVALVEAIRGREECDWIRNVDRYWHVQLATGVPHGIKSWIVNLCQLA